MKKIDVIIPAYNVPNKTLFRCLSSIACQYNIDEIEIYLIDDASTAENYQEIINCFKPIIDIHLLRCKYNGGPGVARQYGIDNSKNPYIFFMDADDTLGDSFALNILCYNLELYDNAIISEGIIYEMNEDGIHFTTHKDYPSWVFGKLYKRDFLIKNNIRFHPASRLNEDAGFSLQINLLKTENDLKIISDAHIYNWHNNVNSLTHQNREACWNAETTGHFYNYIENAIWAFSCVNPQTPGYAEQITFIMYFIYTYWLEVLNYLPEAAEENLKYCKIFYDNFFIKYTNQVDLITHQYQLETSLNNAFKWNMITDIKYDFNSFIEKLNGK